MRTNQKGQEYGARVPFPIVKLVSRWFAFEQHLIPQYRWKSTNLQEGSGGWAGCTRSLLAWRRYERLRPGWKQQEAVERPANTWRRRPTMRMRMTTTKPRRIDEALLPPFRAVSRTRRADPPPELLVAAATWRPPLALVGTGSTRHRDRPTGSTRLRCC